MWSEAREEISRSSKESAIYIGCDSQVYYKSGIRYADYSTVVVLHVDSKHGCKLFHNSVRIKDFSNMRARLLTEVQYALEAFYAIEDVIKERKLEIHLDVNPDLRYASSSVTSEALGWVRGLGLTAKIKPESFAASRAADHCVRNLTP